MVSYFRDTFILSIMEKLNFFKPNFVKKSVFALFSRNVLVNSQLPYIHTLTQTTLISRIHTPTHIHYLNIASIAPCYNHLYPPAYHMFTSVKSINLLFKIRVT